MSRVTYACQRCGNCCRWPGAVRLATEEVPRIAAFLGLAPEAFVDRHTDLMPDRRALTLRSRADGSCVFLEGINTCAIQAVKPLQCAGFPNAWQFPGWRDVCQAKEIMIEEGSTEGELPARRPPAAG